MIGKAARRGLGGALRALMPTIVGTMLLSVLLLAALRTVIPPRWLAPSNEVVGNYLQTLGTIYAVLLAFVVYVVWTHFTETRTRLEEEANELFDIIRMSNSLPEHVRLSVRRLIGGYIDGLIDEEWQGFVRLDERAFEKGWRILDQLWVAIREYEPPSGRHVSIYNELLARFNDLSDARTARIASGLARIPLPLRVLLYFGGISTVASMYLFGVENFAVHAATVALLSGAVSNMLLVIEDLDAPFEGYWQVPVELFERLRRYAAEQSDQPA